MIAIRPRNALFTILQILIGFTFIIVWLPLLRCALDGSSYSWGMTYFGQQFFSEGISAHYWILPVFFLFYLALFWSVYYARNRMLFYILLGVWYVHVFGNLIYEIVVLGDSEFHGDTLNVHVSLSAIVYPVAAIALGLLIWAIVKDRKLAAVAIPWNQRNRRGSWVLAITTFSAGVLFALGEPHGITDQIGVIIALIQSFAWPLLFSPLKIKKGSLG